MSFTGWATLAVLLIIIIYDVCVWQYFGVEATISMFVRRVHEQWPLIAPLLAFAAGVLWGHFFWPLGTK
jgi:hypothetical protein